MVIGDDGAWCHGPTVGRDGTGTSVGRATTRDSSTSAGAVGDARTGGHDDVGGEARDDGAGPLEVTAAVVVHVPQHAVGHAGTPTSAAYSSACTPPAASRGAAARRDRRSAARRRPADAAGEVTGVDDVGALVGVATERRRQRRRAEVVGRLEQPRVGAPPVRQSHQHGAADALPQLVVGRGGARRRRRRRPRRRCAGSQRRHDAGTVPRRARAGHRTAAAVGRSAAAASTSRFGRIVGGVDVDARRRAGGTSATARISSSGTTCGWATTTAVAPVADGDHARPRRRSTSTTGAAARPACRRRGGTSRWSTRCGLSRSWTVWTSAMPGAAEALRPTPPSSSAPRCSKPKWRCTTSHDRRRRARRRPRSTGAAPAPRRPARGGGGTGGRPGAGRPVRAGPRHAQRSMRSANHDS